MSQLSRAFEEGVDAGDGAPHDVDPRQYASVIREMIRHENDVTNHRLMWLLLFQGLVANAYVGAHIAEWYLTPTLAPMGILVCLSTFVLLYKSYQARGYLQFLGIAAKEGRLQEQDLPLTGWPWKRTKGWRRKVWICPWLGRPGDLLEPYLFLPALLIAAWLFVIMRPWRSAMGILPLVILSALLGVAMLAVLSILWVRSQAEDEQESE